AYTPPEEGEVPQTQQPSTKPAKKTKKKEETEAPTKKKTHAAGPTPKGKQPTEKTGTTPLHTAGAPKKPEETEALFKQIQGEATPKGVEKEKKKTKEVAEEIEGTTAPLPKGGWEATKKPEKKEEEGVLQALPEAQVIPTDTSQAAPAAVITSTSEVAPQYLNLPPQLVKLFDRMVGVMTVMTTSGIKETTISLNAPQFAKSVFFGSEITITEFSTAPLEFNIQLTGNAQAVNLFQGSEQELVAAFEAGKYNFKVNRIETGISSGVRKAKPKGKVKPVKKSKEEG
nr:hypothetical protein [Chlamydiota bacterium]